MKIMDKLKSKVVDFIEQKKVAAIMLMVALTLPIEFVLLKSVFSQKEKLINLQSNAIETAQVLLANKDQQLRQSLETLVQSEFVQGYLQLLNTTKSLVTDNSLVIKYVNLTENSFAAIMQNSFVQSYLSTVANVQSHLVITGKSIVANVLDFYATIYNPLITIVATVPQTYLYTGGVVALVAVTGLVGNEVVKVIEVKKTKVFYNVKSTPIK